MLKRRILLAEDDADDRQFFKGFLEDRGDIVVMPIADDGEMLLEILNSINDTANLPELIILDQNMPKINGLRALRLLKADTRYAHIPVTIYSTYTNEDLIKQGLEEGAFQVVSKPTSKKGYYEMMDNFLKASVFAG